MLVLTRKKEEVIRIGSDIEVMVVEVRGDKVRLGVKAPRDIPVDRHEIWLRKNNMDASADAKAARAITGDMPKDIVERVDKACEIVAEAVQAAGSDGKCLDVGCGYGVLVPHLTECGVIVTISQRFNK